MTATDWSNKIFSLALFRMSVNQIELSVGRGNERLGLGRNRSFGAGIGSLRIGANGRVPVSSGFRLTCIRCGSLMYTLG